MQFATTGNAEYVGVFSVFNLERHVREQFFLQALADLARGHELAFAPRLWRSVDAEAHGQCRLIDGDRRHAFGVFTVTDRVADTQILNAGNRDDVTGGGNFSFGARQALECQHLIDLGDTLVFAAEAHRVLLPRTNGAAMDAADADATNIAVVIKRGNLQLQRRGVIELRRRNFRQHGVEQWLHRAALLAFGQARPAVEAAGVNDRKIQLFLGRAKLVEQFEGLIHNPIRTRARTIHLVHDHDDLVTERERLLGHETRLRHRAFDRVHQQQRAVHHRQYALDLTTEVCVARRINDVDTRALVGHRAVLGQNRDAAFALDVVRVHHALAHLFVRREGARLLEQAVDERRLAVVNVGNDCNIAKTGVRAGCHEAA